MGIQGKITGASADTQKTNLSITSLANRGKLASLIYMVALLRFSHVREAYQKAFGNKVLGANNSYE